MASSPRTPRVLKSGIVLLDPVTAAVRQPNGVIVLQYNPDTLTRTLQVQATGSDGGDRSEAFRIKGPPVESLKLEAEIDATDQLEFPDQNPAAAELGIFPQLAVLETIVYPTSSQLVSSNASQGSGQLEIIPMEAPLTLFVWSRSRILPVRITELSVTEEAFEASLSPMRAKVSIGMRVLTINDVGFTHKGGSLFMAYLRAKEQFATRLAGGA